MAFEQIQKALRQSILSLFTVNTVGFRFVALFSVISELFVLYAVVNKVAYTEIDWSTYMQQVGRYMKGELNYTRIRGDTGPIVYPAGHLRIYRILYQWTGEGENIRRAQYIFCLFYLINQLLVFRLYAKSKRIPPFVLLFVTFTSYRVHSIFVLRLFNDPIAMLLFYAALNFFVSQNWYMGCLLYSLAVSVKMNILLFAPALFFVLLLNTGISETFWMLITCAIVQTMIAFEFLLFSPMAYISRAFQFNRVFLFKWTVNWRFLPKKVFLDKRFHLALIFLHLAMLFLFCLLRWFRSQGGITNLTKRAISGLRTRVDTHNLLYAFFTSNLIGMAFARSLHYQFYCWYYHSLPYLLFSSLYPCNGSQRLYQPITSYKELFALIPFKSIALRFLILIGIEYCWNVYPSTPFSSAFLHLLHFIILFMLYQNYDKPSNLKIK